MDNFLVCKHNDLIENYIFNASELELQILNYAAADTNPRWDNRNLVYRIEIPRLVNLYKTKSKSAYKDYRNALSRLMKREYEYYDTSTGEKVRENLIVQIRESATDTSYLKFKFNEYISSRLSELTGFFTQYEIRHISMFKSRYAFMLYELFKMKLHQSMHHDASEYKTKISVDNFKINLGLNTKYRAFKDLELRVLKIAQSNINTHSDINISYKVIRKGRTPTHIVFTAKYKTTKEAKTIAPAASEAKQKPIQAMEKPQTAEHDSSQRTNGKKRLAEIKAAMV